MGKAEKGTPKDIAKRIKAKGLQKLKFWCQVCEKQCRDANGFKCHLTSESHLRQIKLFSDQATGRLNSYSREFEATFLSTLRTRHTTTEVNANNVYQEVIQDRTHVHMNSTIWATLGDFVKYLGRTGKCHVRETDRGWYVSYVEQDSAKLAAQASYEKRHEAEREAERAERDRTERQRAEAAKALDRLQVDHEVRATELDPNRGGAIRVTIHAAAANGSGKQNPSGDAKDKAPPSNVFGELDGGSDEDDDDDSGGPPPGVPLPASAMPPSRPQKKERNDEDHRKQSAPAPPVEPDNNWLLPDILVRILDKKSQFYDRKAVVNRVDKVRGGTSKEEEQQQQQQPEAAAHVTILDTGRDRNDGGQEVAIRASRLETVVPKEGKRAYVLRGRHRGRGAVVLTRNDRKSRASLKLEGSGEILERVPYDDFSKAA